MKIKVSELIVRYLEKIGIETIFGIPGAHILPMYDSLYHSTIQSVLVKHEQGAAFMAGGFARSSGKIGACITTAGPGATNLVTGIANAYADKLPLIIITGEAPTYVFGKGGLQESSGEGGSIDQRKLFEGISCYHKIIERTDYLANILNNVSTILFAEISGPVILSLPFNIQNEEIDEALLDEIKTRKKISCVQTENGNIDTFVSLLIKAKKPVIVCGYGCIKANAQKQLQALSEQINIPVCSSLKSKGVVDETSALSLGTLGVTSAGYAYDYIVNQADLIIILGAGFNERTSYLWNRTLLKDRKIIQVDLDAKQLEKVYLADLAIHADIKTTLSSLLLRLEQQAAGKKVLEDISVFKQKKDARSEHTGTKVFNENFSLIKHFYQSLHQHLEHNAIIFDDNIIFAQNFYPVHSGIQYHPNSGISSLGHAIPAAIGSQFASPGKTFAIIGDGGFQMCCMEIMTAVNYNIPLNIILFNNNTMGLIRKNQQQTYHKRYINCDFVNPDYRLLAQSFGIHYYKISNDQDIQQLFNHADLAEKINIIEIPLDKDAMPNYSSRR